MFGKSYTELKESLDPPLLLWLMISSVFLLGCLFVAYLEHKAGRSLSLGIAAFISNFMWAQNPMLYIWRQSRAELSKHWTCFYQYVGLTCLIHITWVEVVMLEANSSMNAFLPCLDPKTCINSLPMKSRLTSCARSTGPAIRVRARPHRVSV